MTKKMTSSIRDPWDPWAPSAAQRRKERAELLQLACITLVLFFALIGGALAIYFGYRPMMSHDSYMSLVVLGLLGGACAGGLVALPTLAVASKYYGIN